MARTNRPRSRRGYTLFELLLVLAVLLVVVGLTWSSIASIYKHEHLARAAHDVRLRLAVTRAQAIESGTILQFVYEPGGRAYSVLPLEQVADAAAQPANSSSELPETIRFEVPDGSETISMADASSATANSDLGGTSSASISVVAASAGSAAPILFAPDGTSSDAAFDIVDGEGRFVRVSVRGLTAAVSVTSPSAEGQR